MIALPFNFQPDSVSVKTSSYDIPAGSYAYVTFCVRAGGTGTIDGSTAIDSLSNTNGDSVGISQASSLGTINNYTVPTDYVFEGYVTQSTGTNAAVTVGGNQLCRATNQGSGTDAGSGPVVIRAGGGDVVSVASVSGAFTYIIGYSTKEGSAHDPVTASFWVPTGTTINGTSTWYATVALYNELT